MCHHVSTVQVIIDFDSTLVSVESLDELGRIALAQNPNQEQIMREIDAITRAGMEGHLSFTESLKSRLRLFQASREHITQLIPLLTEKVTPSARRNKDFFTTHRESLYIVSGGFAEYVVPVAAELGIAADHVYANTFVFDAAGMITGFDETNPLAHDQGKVICVRSLPPVDIRYVIGDGMTDYQVREAGAAHTFYAFTENVTRPTVVAKADARMEHFDVLAAAHIL